MELLFNDLSVHGQFESTHDFGNAVAHVMKMRSTAEQYGTTIYCHRNFTQAKVTYSLTMTQAVQQLPLDQRRALMQWVTQYGPFWDDEQIHSHDEYLQCGSNIVTDTAVGEAAFCCANGQDRRLISFSCSDWNYSPIPVQWFRDSREDKPITMEIRNYHDNTDLESTLKTAPTPVSKWDQLPGLCQARCPQLVFAQNAFAPLEGEPFVLSAANRIVTLLDMLNNLRCCIDESGKRTLKGDQIVNDHFQGGKAWFTDSSDTEKSDFRNALTFAHPTEIGQQLFCTWHGKIKTPQYRIHFSDPFDASQPICIVYVGQKITKK